MTFRYMLGCVGFLYNVNRKLLFAALVTKTIKYGQREGKEAEHTRKEGIGGINKYPQKEDHPNNAVGKLNLMEVTRLLQENKVAFSKATEAEDKPEDRRRLQGSQKK